ncbi:MAG: ATP-binding protein [Flavobacteriales bacterium]|nr:ATP-binding protein [Flavobacteriales bacterium]
MRSVNKIDLAIGQAEILRLLGELNQSLHTYDSLIEYYPSDAIQESPELYSDVFRFRANVHFEKENYEQAYRDAAKSLQVNFHPLGYVLAAPILSKYFETKGLHDSALKVLFKAESLALEKIRKENRNTQLGVIYTKISEIFALQNKKEKAYYYLEKAEKFAKESKDYYVDDQIVYEGSRKVYQKFGDYKKAFESLLKRETAEETLSYYKQLKEVEARASNYQKKALKFENDYLVLQDHNNKRKLYLQRWLLFSISGLLLIFVLFVWILYDRNRRIRHLNQKISEQNIILLKQQEAYKYIFTTLAHDLRGPLHSLRMLQELQTMEGNESGGETAFKDLLNERLEAAEETLHSLLNWARLELNIQIPHSGYTPLIKVAEDVVKSLRPQAQEKNIHFEISIPQKIAINIPGDFVKIILRNILSNAIKFSPSGEKITILYYPEEKTLRVEDKGGGMHPEILEKIKKSVVIDNPSEDKGQGVGLYISSQIAKRLGLTLGFESHLTEGTLVSIGFPDDILA